MEGLVAALDVLLRQGILPTAFIMGSVAFFLALIGKIPVGDGHDISPIPRFFLGFFGLILALAGLGGALFGIFVVKETSSTSPTQQVNTVVELSQPPIIVTATTEPPITRVISTQVPTGSNPSSFGTGRTCYCTPAGCDLDTLLFPGETFHPAPQNVSENPYYLILSSRTDGYYYWSVIPVSTSYICQSPETGCSAWGYYSSRSCAISEAERECRARGSSCAGVIIDTP